MSVGARRRRVELSDQRRQSLTSEFTARGSTGIEPREDGPASTPTNVGEDLAAQSWRRCAGEALAQVSTHRLSRV